MGVREMQWGEKWGWAGDKGKDRAGRASWVQASSWTGSKWCLPGFVGSHQGPFELLIGDKHHHVPGSQAEEGRHEPKESKCKSGRHLPLLLLPLGSSIHPTLGFCLKGGWEDLVESPWLCTQEQESGVQLTASAALGSKTQCLEHARQALFH